MSIKFRIGYNTDKLLILVSTSKFVT